MASLFFMYVIHHVALVVGLACSLVIDLFMIIVEKYKKIRSLEKGIVNRVLSFSFLSALIVFLTELVHMFLLFFTDTGGVYDSWTYIRNTITTSISGLLVFCIATQKYYQIKTLYRYQEQHQHLSDSFIKHHVEIRNTAILCLLLWISLYMCYVLLN
jgi:hypothetical protein